MRRRLITTVAALTVVMTASAAHAATITVNAARNEYAHNSTRYCGVIVDDYFEYNVNVYCFGSGTAWFKVKVPGVRGKILSVNATGRGDCSGKHLSFRRSKSTPTTVLVTISHSGDFDCTYRSVSVDYRR